MFLRKKAKKPPTGIRETVAGITSQIDHLVAIIQDPTAPASDRITATEIVRSFVDFQSLSSITEIWYATRGLTAIINQPEVRRAGWRLCLSCIARDELNNSAFSAYYASIIRNANVEDFELVLSCLEQLTNGGRRVVGTQAPRHLPQVLLEWIQLLAIRTQEIRSNASAQDVALQWGTSTEESFHRLMNYTIALLKFNMPVWEPVEIEKLLLVAVAIIRQTSQVVDCELCCLIIEAVMAYGLLPASVLQPVMEVLCGIITMIPSLRDLCERIILALSSSHLQNSTFVRLCRIVDSPTSEITTGMQIAAAQQLKTLLIRGSSDQSSSSRYSAHESTASGGGGVLEDRSAFVGSSDNSPAGGSVLGNALGDDSGSGIGVFDPSLPVNEVLESYLHALVDPAAQPKLVVALAKCCNELIMDFGLLKWVRFMGFSEDSIPGFGGDDGNDDELAAIGSSDSVNISPVTLVLNFDRVCRGISKEDAPEAPALRQEMQTLGELLVDSLKDKNLASSLTQQILLSIRISHYMTVGTCESLLESIDRMQFCTPGVYEWFGHLKEVMKYIYMRRTDRCRAHVLRSVEDIYALDAQEEGWISVEDLAWITSTTFEALSTADDETLQVLIKIYETRVFFSNHIVFQNATTQLVNAAANGGLVKAVEALTYALSRAFKLHAKQALTILDALQIVAMQSLDKPEVFVRAWAVLCRLRSDRWDRLCFIEQAIAEDAYGADLLEEQQPLPDELKPALSIPSLVLKIRAENSDDSVKSARLDTSRFLEIVIKALKSSSERPFVLVLINLASQLAHYRFMCNPVLVQNFALLRVLRDEMMQIVSSGGSRVPQGMAASRRNACLNVLVHCLTVLLPLRELFTRVEQDRMVHILVDSLGQRNVQTDWAVYYLLVACYESPSSIQRFLPQILSRLQLKITSRDSSVYILDFLLSISLEGSLTKNFTNQDYKRVFGMSFLFIQNANDMLTFKDKQNIGAQWRLQLAYSAVSNLFLSIKLENRRSMVPYLARTLVLTNKNTNRLDPANLVTYDLINRFTYSDVPLRVNMVSLPDKQPGWEVRRWLRGVAIFEIRCNRHTGEALRIVRRPAGVLATKMEPALIEGLDTHIFESESEDAGQYTSNFYLLCGQLGLATFNRHMSAEHEEDLTGRDDNPNGGFGVAAVGKGSNSSSNATNTGDFIPSTGSQEYATVNIESGSHGSRMNSGTSESGASIAPSITGNSSRYEASTSGVANGSGESIGPSHAGGNKTGGTHNGSDTTETTPVTNTDQNLESQLSGYMRPLALPDDPATNRAVKALDRVPMVDFYKVGIIYVAPGQRNELEILANSCGSPAYRKFLDQIGVLIRLKNNRTYYVGGLDTDQDLDGEFALAWSSKISQIIFHTTTMMPQLPGDTLYANKKRHIGNNFVNIYFDESGEDFVFDVVKSQFNFINIVITPTYLQSGNQRYWKVRALRKPGMMNSLVAYEVKVVSESNLALFVRNLTLKASQYAAIHNAGSDYMDNWVYRMQLIVNLHDRLIQQLSQTPQNSQRQKQDPQQSPQQKPNEGNENGSILSDDDYILEEPGLNEAPTNQDIKILHWMDFTKFTI